MQDFAFLRGSVGLRHVLLSLPMAAFYLVGGVNDFTSFLLPVASTLINVVFISNLAKRLWGKDAGQVGGFLWIFIPTSLFTASSAQYVQPIISLFLGGLILLLRWEQAGKPSARLGIFFISIVLFVLDYMVALCFLVLFFNRTLLRSHKSHLAWVPVSVFAAGLFTLINWNIGLGFVSFYENLVQIPEMRILLPMLILATAISVQKVDRNTQLPLTIAAVCFLGLLWRSYSSADTALIFDPLFSLLLAANFLLYSKFLSQADPFSILERYLPILCVAFIGIIWLGISGQTNLIYSLSGTDWLSTQSIILLLKILPGPVLVLLVAFYWFSKRGSGRERSALSAFVLVLLPLSLIPFSWQRTQEYRPSIVAANQALELIGASEMDLPVYVFRDSKLAVQLEYINSEKEQIPVGRIKYVDNLEIENGYVLYWESDIHIPFGTWWQMAFFGNLGKPRLVVARTLGVNEAARALENAMQIQGADTAKNYEAMYGAAINAGEMCKAVLLWIESRAVGMQTQGYFPLYSFPINECYDLLGAQNLLEDQQPVYYPGYGIVRYTSEDSNLQGGAQIGHKYPFFEDPRTIYLQAKLKPDAIYLYHVDIRGPEEAMPLYWNIDGYENYLDYDFYRSWTPLTVLVSTANWSQDALTVTLSPFLYYVDYFNGTFDIRDYQLIEITAEMMRHE
ncbi:MAG: hypothetical protein WD751_07220 [Anaerolineales bacterium]